MSDIPGILTSPPHYFVFPLLALQYVNINTHSRPDHQHKELKVSITRGGYA
jgi:hypothetical protein